MRRYDPYRFESQRDKRKKKKRGAVQKTVIFAVTLFVLLIAGAIAYVVLDTYDYSPSSAFSDLFNRGGQDEPGEEAQIEYENADFLAFITANRSDEVYAIALIHAGLKEKTFSVITLPPETLAENGEKEETLEEMLYSSGAESVCRAVERLTGVKIARHIRATQGGFEKLVDKLGGVSFNVERDLVYSSDKLSMHVQGGEQKLTGSVALNVMRYPEWEHGELYQYKTQAKLIAALIDQHLNAQNAEKGDDLFNALINLVQSDISVADYRACAQMIVSYASLEDKKPTLFSTARGTYVETESGKTAFRLTGKEDFKQTRP